MGTQVRVRCDCRPSLIYLMASNVGHTGILPSIRPQRTAGHTSAAKRSDRQVPACAGHTSWPTYQDKSSPVAKPCWTNALAPNFPAAPPCTDILASAGHALETPRGAQTICFKNLGLAGVNADQYLSFSLTSIIAQGNCWKKTPGKPSKPKR